MVQKWILPTLSEVLALSESTITNCPSGNAKWTAATQIKVDVTTSVRSLNQNATERVKAERQWCGAVAALEQLLLQSIDSDTSSSADGQPQPACGLMFAGPVPIFSHTELRSNLQTWIFTASSLESIQGTPFQLPPATGILTADSSHTAEIYNGGLVLPLLVGDPLLTEKFCLVLTTGFSLVMVLGEDNSHVPTFRFSFEPEVVEQAWRVLRERVLLSSPQFPIFELDAFVERYHPRTPDYRTVMQFSRLLLKYLPEPEARSETPLHPSHRPDVELLQAFAHEVRTPLTTIRTLTRLLLKRRDLAVDVNKRLEIIDYECTEQIDRMELLFRAAELQTSTCKHQSAHLTAMSLTQVLQQSIPRWQKQASRRNLTLDVILPQHLPTVVSDPTMLDQILTSLVENFTRSLPAGSHIQVQVIPAGEQLKLQLRPQSQPGKIGKAPEQCPAPVRKSLGQMLMLQPETGNISLNLTATQHLFQAIGGKLIVRQLPHQGEVVTIFLPMDVKKERRG